MTETCNVYGPMPEHVDDLLQLKDKLEALRRANVAHHVDLIAAAAGAGARVIGLGELFTAPYFALGNPSEEVVELWKELAEDALRGPTITELRAAALEHDCVLVAPIYELDADTGERFNTAVVIDEKGQVLGKYRKNHIPVGANEAGSFHETLFYGPGNGRLDCDVRVNISGAAYFPVFETSRARIGVAICYDRHFPRVMRTLAENGAQLVFSPAITFGAHSRAMWELEFPVDAARNRIFIAGSNRRGREAPWNQEYFGASYFSGPGGRLPDLSARPELVMADLDLTQLDGACSSGWNLARDSRPDIYR